tara:strand:- start:1125 stop:1445 length:321 start_codon:yes stop_codon:yes gene_type:complete
MVFNIFQTTEAGVNTQLGKKYHCLLSMLHKIDPFNVFEFTIIKGWSFTNSIKLEAAINKTAITKSYSVKPDCDFFKSFIPNMACHLNVFLTGNKRIIPNRFVWNEQ